MYQPSKYKIFIEVIGQQSFTRAAETIGYSQSAISQVIKSLEKELDAVLLERRKDGVFLTKDGMTYWPYIQAIVKAEEDLEHKRQEHIGLENTAICIGAFTSVSRNHLPRLMSGFKQLYPKVNFVIKQGDYTNIHDWIEAGSIDFGFNNKLLDTKYEGTMLHRDYLQVVLPLNHPLAAREEISLADMENETFILLDEGENSVIVNTFQRHNIKLQPAYTIYDDYTILAMVKQGLGISILYQEVLSGFEEGVVIKPIKEQPYRNLQLIWKNSNTIPTAAKRFIQYIIRNFEV